MPRINLRAAERLMMLGRVLYMRAASARAELYFSYAVATVGFIVDLAIVDVVSAKHHFGVGLAAVDAVDILTKITYFLDAKVSLTYFSIGADADLRVF